MKFAENAALYFNPINKQRIIIGKAKVLDNECSFSRTKAAINFSDTPHYVEHLVKVGHMPYGSALELLTLPDEQYHAAVSKLVK